MDTWESISSVERLDPSHLHSASMVASLESSITHKETRFFEDDNLNFTSPIGDDGFLFHLRSLTLLVTVDGWVLAILDT